LPLVNKLPLERFSYRVRLWQRVSAMPEVAACVFIADRPERVFGGLQQSLKCPRLSPPQNSAFTLEKASSMGLNSGE
jgi:hypothetical protein